MKRQLCLIFTLLGLFVFYQFLMGQEQLLENINNGAHSPLKRRDFIKEIEDKKFQLDQSLSYNESTVLNLRMENCIYLIRDFSKNMELEGIGLNDYHQTETGNSWIINYSLDALWPVKNTNPVGIRSANAEGQIANLSLTVSLSKLDGKNLKYVTSYILSHNFKNLGNDKIKINTTATISPVTQAPEWLLSKFFKDKKGNYIKDIIKKSIEYN